MASALEQLAPGFLIAAPMLHDPNFDRTLVLMCLHNEQGALGLVINRPSPLSMKEILGQLDLPTAGAQGRDAMIGGPVAVENGMLLYRCPSHEEAREDEIHVTDDLRLTPNRDMLEQIARGDGPGDYLMFLGHSGWGPGQLESEMSAGAWIPASLNTEIIFDTPVDERWGQALQDEGINPVSLGSFKPQA